MTTATIHPIVLEKLQRFRRQRQRLIWVRGLCSTLAVWLGAMIVLALVDRLVVLPDALRMGLSITGYVATGVMFWIECGRYLVRRLDARELARLMELAAPQLREELLSAIELAETDARWDSTEFRAALQAATAHDVGDLQINRLLTGKLIAGWLYAAGAAGAVLLVLLLAPGLRFPQSFARAVLPGANLARYSNVQITVLAPTPPDQIAPEGDSVPVTVEVTGPAVKEVILETLRPAERTLMMLSAANQFTATVQLNQTPVQFRVRARDAITRLYTLTPRPRPHIVRFHKTYQYPSYTRLPAMTVTEENGDLDALEGTTVELNLEVDQPIREAALQLETGTGATTKQEIPLARDPNVRLLARVPLTAAGTFQIRLVAAQTGFENKYSPQYEIRVRPDLLPFVKIDRPERDQVLPPDSIINLTGSAKDDLGLANIVHAIQVNRGEWQTVPLAAILTGDVTVARAWDLFELGVHPGDHILTKLVATDLKGQRGESAPLRILIASPGFEPDRLKNLQDRQALNQSILELSELSEQLHVKTREARAVVFNPAADAIQKQQALLTATTAADATDRKAAAVLRQIKDTLPRTESARAAADLALVGSAISRAHHEGIQATKTALERATEQVKTGTTPAAQAALEKIAEPLAASALARTAAETDKQLLAVTEANLALRDLQQLATEQRSLADQLATHPERATHRLTVAADQAKALEDQLRTFAAHAGAGPGHTARNLAQDLARHRENVERALTNAPTAAKLQAPANALQQSLANAANAARNFEPEVGQRAETARKALQDQTGTAADTTAKLTNQLLRRDAPQSTDEAWQAAVAQLHDRVDLEERRPQADPQFTHALGRTAEALEALHDTTGGDQPATNAVPNLRAIEQALRQLQTGQTVTEQATALRHLAAQERWEKPITPAAITDRVNDWKWSQQQLDRIQAPVEIKRALEAATKNPTANQITNELNQRRANPANAANLSEPLTQVAGGLDDVKQKLAPALEQARAEIDKLAPALSDRLAGLARTAEKLNTDTTAQTRQPDPAEIQNLATAQQHLENRIENVKDALRRDANAQDLTTDESRARARDADNAVAILRQKPVPTAAELLQHAATTAQPDQQQRDLKDAAQQQAKLADDLKQLAAHYKNTEAGQPELTRAALRETEKELGLKTALDTEYAKIAALQNLATLPPEQQLAELEHALEDNQPLRQALSEIAQTTLQSAATNLEKSAEREQQIGQLAAIEQARQIAAAAQKLARQDLPALTQQAGEVAKPELAAAAQRLAVVAAATPQDTSKPPEQTAQQMQNQVAPLQQAAADLEAAAQKLEPTAPAVAAQTRQASEQATQLADQAAQVANALNPAPPQQQAQQIAAAAKKLADQDVPAIAEKAGPTAQPELQRAGQNLENVATRLPDAAAQSPAQLAKALQNQVAPLQQAAADLKTAGTKTTQAAQELQKQADAATEKAKAEPTNAEAARQAQAAQQQARTSAQQAHAAQQQARQASQQAERLAQQAGQLATELNQNQPAAQAKQLAEAVKKLAEQSVPSLAAKAGDTAPPELGTAGEKLTATAKNLPTDTTQPAAQLAKQVQHQVAPLQQAAADLQAAAAKLDPALAPQARQASAQAAQLATQAEELAKSLNPTPVPTGEQAKQLAAAAQKLAQQDLPALVPQADATARPELGRATQKLANAANSIPQDFSRPADQILQQMQNQVAPLQQAAADLEAAAAKQATAAQAAQQRASAAGQQAQQAQANNAPPAVQQQAATAHQQAQAAAQQAQAANQQAQQAAQTAGQLAQQAAQLAAAMNQAKPLLQAVAQQPAIEQTVRTAGNDIERAGRHETRLGQDDQGQQLQQLGQTIESKTGDQVAQAATAMAHASSPTQLTPVAQAAQTAIQAAAQNVNAARSQLSSSPGTPPGSTAAPSQLAATAPETAKWLARTLDSLDANLNPPGTPVPPSAAPNPAAFAAQSAAQAQSATMLAARNSGLAPGEQPVAQSAGQVSGTGDGGGGPATGDLPDVRPAGGNWGKLPPKLARDLLDSQREGVGGEYREMVEMYFRAIADKARETKP
ncbi:MAG: hypothetical protein PCFJNLEI_02448 [Verrucomicrobiae bacterium]|nr:hypothetical protein [Verrucomicrobiae bacterium]